MFQAMAYGAGSLHFYAMEAFGVRNAALGASTPLLAGAAVDTIAALELDRDRLAAPIADHAAAPEIRPPVPPPSVGPFPRWIAEPGIVYHVNHLPLRSEEHTSELQSRQYLVCRLLLEKKKKKKI